LAAVTTARMKGWQTKTFTEKAYEHHKKTQYGGNTSLAAIFRSGYHDYLMGSHPVWQLFRSVYQMTRKPVFIGGSALLVGYFWGVLRQAEKIVPKGIVDFRRREQMQRLGRFLKSPPSV